VRAATRAEVASARTKSKHEAWSENPKVRSVVGRYAATSARRRSIVARSIVARSIVARSIVARSIVPRSVVAVRSVTSGRFGRRSRNHRFEPFEF